MPSIMSVLGTAGRSLREGVFEPRILQQAQQRTDLKKKEQRQTEADFIIEAREAWLALDQEMLNNVLEKYKRAVPTQTFRTIAENITEAINVVKKERAKKGDELQVPFPTTPGGELDVTHAATVGDPGFQFLQERLRKQGLTPEKADTEIQEAYKASPQMLPISDAMQYGNLQASRDTRSGRQQQANPRIVKSFVDAIIADPSTSIGILSSDIISKNTRSAILNELSSRPDFNLQGAFKAHEDAKKRPGHRIIIGGREIPWDLYNKVEKRAIDVLKLEAGKKPWGEQDQIPYDKIQAKTKELLSKIIFPNGATQSTSGGSWSKPDDPMHTVPEFPIPDTSGVDTLTAGVPPPTTQQDQDYVRQFATVKVGGTTQPEDRIEEAKEWFFLSKKLWPEIANTVSPENFVQSLTDFAIIWHNTYGTEPEVADFVKYLKANPVSIQNRPRRQVKPTAADTVSAVPDTLGVDTLTAGGTPAAPPPTPQQGSETFRYTDSVLAQKIIDALYSLKLQIEDNAGQSTPQQEAAVEFLKTKLDSLRIP